MATGEPEDDAHLHRWRPHKWLGMVFAHGGGDREHLRAGRSTDGVGWTRKHRPSQATHLATSGMDGGGNTGDRRVMTGARGPPAPPIPRHASLAGHCWDWQLVWPQPCQE